MTTSSSAMMLLVVGVVVVPSPSVVERQVDVDFVLDSKK